MNVILKYIVSYLLVTLWGLFIFNNTSNTHTHILSNGKKVVHSHPFSKDTKHNHTKTQYDFLNTIHHLSAKTNNCYIIEKAEPILFNTIITISYNFIKSGIPILEYSHSPPYLG